MSGYVVTGFILDVAGIAVLCLGWRRNRWIRRLPLERRSRLYSQNILTFLLAAALCVVSVIVSVIGRTR